MNKSIMSDSSTYNATYERTGVLKMTQTQSPSTNKAFRIREKVIITLVTFIKSLICIVAYDIHWFSN